MKYVADENSIISRLLVRNKSRMAVEFPVQYSLFPRGFSHTWCGRPDLSSQAGS